MSGQDTLNSEINADSSEQIQEQEVETGENSGADLQKMLEEAQAKAEQNWDKLLRTKAEFDNLQKRAQKDIENAHKYSLEKIMGELLGVRDSIEMGLGASAGENVTVDTLKEGMELTVKMLVQIMEKFGAEEVDPQGEKFNPDLHQAMSTQESAELAPNTVISVMQKGYKLNDRLLRPALVIVSKSAEKEEI